MKEKIIREKKYTYRQLFEMVGGGGKYLHVKEGLYNYNALAAERTRQNDIANSQPGNGKFFLSSTIKEGYVSIGQRY